MLAVKLRVSHLASLSCLKIQDKELRYEENSRFQIQFTIHKINLLGIIFINMCILSPEEALFSTNIHSLPAFCQPLCQALGTMIRDICFFMGPILSKSQYAEVGPQQAEYIHQ